MAKTEKLLKRFYNLYSPRKAYYSKLFTPNMTFMSYVIFGISELFAPKLSSMEGIYNV